LTTIEETLTKLHELKLTSMAQAVRELMDTAPGHQLSFDEKLGLVVDREWADRDNRRLARRLKEAKLVTRASLDNVLCDPERGVDKATMRALSTCQWVKTKHNVVVVGKTGVGKSYVGAALADAACRAGYRANFFRVPRLLEELALARAAGVYASLLGKLSRIDVLVLDSCGVLAYVESRSRLRVVLDFAVAALHITRLRRLTSVPLLAPTMEVTNACRDLSAGSLPVHVAALAWASS
jgi:DNA replication protein DnaC